MKRAPLRRRTGGLKRTLRAKARPDADKVSAIDRLHVLRRDGECIARKLIRAGWTPAGHVCRDQFGNLLPMTIDPERHLTIEHVKDTPAMGARAPSDRAHMVAACAEANNGDYWCSKYRTYILVYLKALAENGKL